MPNRPKRPCNKAGCTALTDTGWCELHQQHTAKQYDRQRGKTVDRGYDANWKKVRLMALLRDMYLCRYCKGEGRLTPAIEVHHVQTVADRPDLRLDLENLRSICRSCHLRLTPRSI